MSNKLDNWRKQIDVLDGKILNLLAKRLGLVKKIGEYKKMHNLLPLDKKRWDQVLKSNLIKSVPLHLSDDFVKKLFTLIHQYSLKLQKKP